MGSVVVWYLIPRLSLEFEENEVSSRSETPKYRSASCNEGKNPSLEKLLSL